jgi:ABC-2 type transport system permease protein
MSAVDTRGTGQSAFAVDRISAQLGLRLYRSEVTMIIRRRRNQLILAVLAAIPTVIGIAVKLTSSSSSATGLIGSITENGIFVAFTALVVVLPIFLPMAVSVVVGESIAGEAGLGTLRYLLTVPVSRTRLLLTKLVAAATWCLLCAATVAVAGVIVGFILFPRGKVLLLSGTETTLIGGIGRLAVVVGYATLMMLAIAALGVFVSALTEVAIAAMAATLAAAITMQVLVIVPQLHAIHGLLITNYFLDFSDVLRDPLSFAGLTTGCWVALAYVLIFGSLAWARFTTKDISG